MLTTADIPRDVWLSFLKSKEKDGVDVFDPSNIDSLSKEFMSVKEEENKKTVEEFHAESEIDNALKSSITHLKELHSKMKKVGKELESGLTDKIPESLNINYDNSPSKYDGSFYIYPEIEGGNNSHEFYNNKVFQEIKSNRKNQDSAVISISASNVSEETLPNETVEYLNDTTKMKKLSFNLHSNGVNFFVNDRDYSSTESISASDFVSFISNNISNKEQKSSLTIALYACYGALEVDSEKGSLLHQISQGLIDEGFSGIKLTGSENTTLLTGIPGENTIKLPEDNDLEFTTEFPAPVGSMMINKGYEGQGNEKYSKSDEKVSIHI